MEEQAIVVSEAEVFVPDQDGEVVEEEIALPSPGSSLGGAIFNFTNSIIGAGAIALGGAMAGSGGGPSILGIIFFGYLAKASMDMLIEVSHNHGGTYEDLGRKCYGTAGWLAVFGSKFFFTFGGMVAYIVVIKDTFSAAFSHLLYGDNPPAHSILANANVLAIFLSVTVLLPLCLLRDMTPLSKLSLVSIAAMMSVMGIVMYLYFANPDDIRLDGGTEYERWVQVRPHILESLGTFIFTFVNHHVVHLTFESLRPELRTYENWKFVSFWSITVSILVSLGLGVFVYMTFWQQADSDMFKMYPDGWTIIYVGQLLLCFQMLLTFPFPFFVCREMLIIAMNSTYETFVACCCARPAAAAPNDAVELEEPLLDQVGLEPEMEEQQEEPQEQQQLPCWLQSERQLILPLHVMLTVSLWAFLTVLAVIAPSLGAVVDLVGCATGTIMAFILPAMFSFRIKGFSFVALLSLVVGGIVGSIGTFYSVKNLINGK